VPITGAQVGVEPGVDHVREPPVVEDHVVAGRVTVVQQLRPGCTEMIIERLLGPVGEQPGRRDLEVGHLRCSARI
jgi:hypothetical protein